MKKRSLAVLLSVTLLAGCETLYPQEESTTGAPVVPVSPPAEPTPAPPQPQPSQPTTPVVPQPPKVVAYDWQGSVQPLVAKMIKIQGISPGSMLLLNNVKNATNGQLPVGQVVDALYQALGQNSLFRLVTPQQLLVARQSLGLSADDRLTSRSKAIGLARFVGAQYVLYSAVHGSVQAPQLEMQLMAVQSGEIVWSGKQAVQLR